MSVWRFKSRGLQLDVLALPLVITIYNFYFGLELKLSFLETRDLSPCLVYLLLHNHGFCRPSPSPQGHI